eukprot:TRINITY_DN7057_c0_g1_i1.p1 TRINITY_DN7057_c0_g1~~TRINITY_DN7057_c0_g1_i1.p1  ORF type:complete len:215 (-),score=47.85 TRINITY_DN7057_c0_g1_i1:385-1029(-)
MASGRFLSGADMMFLDAGEENYLQDLEGYDAKPPLLLGLKEFIVPVPSPNEVPLPEKDWLVTFEPDMSNEYHNMSAENYYNMPSENYYYNTYQNAPQKVSKSPQHQVQTIVDQQLQKTKLCSFHVKGKCAFGTTCTFAHDPVEVRGMPNLSKTKICTKWRRNACFNKNCKYAHGFEELRNTPMLYKTAMCTAAMSGSCSLGDRCRFAHTPDELR